MKRKYPTHPIVAVGIIIIHKGRLLLAKRDVEPDKGKWTVPGGAVELGEKVREAAVREAKEECGLEIEIVDKRPIDVVDNIVIGEKGPLKYHYILLQFSARLEGGVLRPGNDVKEVKWVLLEEVEKHNLTEGFRAFFEKYQNELKARARKSRA